MEVHIAIANQYRDIPLAIYHFDNFRFDSISGELTTQDHQQRLEPAVARLLCFFLDNNNELLSRDIIIEVVWEGRVVSDDTLNRGISILRQTLNPNDKAAYIRTIPKRGYQSRFTLTNPQLHPSDEPDTPPATNTSKTISPKSLFLTNKAIFTSLLIIMVSVVTIFILDTADNAQLTKAATSSQSIAVLPFLDVSNNEANAYVGEGISDTIISTLSTQQNLQIIARTSSFSLDQSQLSIAEIASKLGANYILEGSTQLNDDKLKVNARLIDVETETAVWASSFSRSLNDVLKVQEDIAQSVLIAVSGSLLGLSNVRYQPTFEAYNQMILGRHALNLQSTPGLLTAKAHFEKAIELDTHYALAYVMLANCLQELNRINPQTQEYNSRQYSVEDIHKLIDTALTIQPLQSEAHSLKGKLYMQSRQFELAKSSLEKAMSINPNNAMALADLVRINLSQNEINLAVINARKALVLNPQDSKIQQLLASTLWHNGRAEEAIKVIEESIKVNPKAANNYSLLSRWTLQMGDAFKAMDYAVKEWDLDPDNPSRHWLVCLMHVQVWDEQKAHQCIDSLLAKHPDYYEAKQYRFILNGDHDGAIALIRKQVNAYPNAVYYKLQLASRLVINLQWQEGLTILAEMYPNLMSQKPIITAANIWGANSLGEALMMTGQTHQAELILSNLVDFIDKSRKLQDGGYTSGIDDVLALALLGDLQEALDRLEIAIDNGWLFYSYVYFKMPQKSLENSERFQALEQKLRRKAEAYQDKIARELGPDLGF